jgi:hypothetical protein
MRLQFEKGDITLYEWVPVKIKLHGLLNNEQIENLKIVFPGCSIIDYGRQDPDSDYSSLIPVESTSQRINQEVTGRFKKVVFDRLITLEYGDIAEKKDRYELLLISMIKDQWNWLLDNTVIRVIDDINAVESLRMAETATNMAHCY